jgi:flagellar hook-associated protein 3 FlgL
MRVSDSLLFYLSKGYLSGARQKVATAQERVLTGKEVAKPSDDPTAYVQGLKESARGSRAERQERTINVALLALQVADDALGQVTDALQTIAEKALSAANDPLGAEERAALAKEVEALREHILSLANSQAEGKFIFGGYLDNASPFDSDGQYQGSSDVAHLEVARGVKLPAGVSGNRVFSADGGQDIFAALDHLKTALETNDVETARASLDPISKAQSQIIAARSELGATTESYQVAAAVAQQAQTRATENKSELVEIDAIEAASNLARAQQALETAVVIAGRLPLPGLASS